MLETVLYILVFVVVSWSYTDYLFFLNSRKKKLKLEEPRRYKRFTILVPCFNEESTIDDKIRNLLSIDYPKRLQRIIFVDGGSTDRTIEIIKRYSKKYNLLKIVVPKKGGKIPDLNAILPKLTSDYVMITDADSRVERNVLKVFSKILENPKVGAVGALTSPEKAISEEKTFWNISNKVRILESLASSTSTLIAAAYAFKNKLVSRFPRDVIADDFYMALKIKQRGYRAIYTPLTKAIEKRAPQSFSDLLKSKMRKSAANIKELSRFSKFTFKQGGFFWNVIFPTKLIQTFIAPFLLFVFIFLSIYMLFKSPLIFVLVLLISILSFIATKTILSKIKIPAVKTGILTQIRMTIVLNLILIISILKYPFTKKTSRYARIGAESL